MALHFLHGAGGFDFDRPLADALAAELDTELRYPRLSDDDRSVPDGWDSDDYAFSGPPPATSVVLHHCRDDEDVPVAHLELNRAVLPSAAVHAHDTGGHQFAGRVAAVAASVRGD